TAFDGFPRRRSARPHLGSAPATTSDPEREEACTQTKILWGKIIVCLEIPVLHLTTDYFHLTTLSECSATSPLSRDRNVRCIPTYGRGGARCARSHVSPLRTVQASRRCLASSPRTSDARAS